METNYLYHTEYAFSTFESFFNNEDLKQVVFDFTKRESFSFVFIPEFRKILIVNRFSTPKNFGDFIEFFGWDISERLKQQVVIEKFGDLLKQITMKESPVTFRYNNNLKFELIKL